MNEPSAAVDDADSGATLKFRNYRPRTPALRQYVISSASVVQWEAELDNEIKHTIDTWKFGDIASQLQPQRPNFDLKRDLNNKLDTLSRRTDKAIVELIRSQIPDTE
eukprot:Lankesteria_metandrocarpae@DN100_c0_g1_i1.p1